MLAGAVDQFDDVAAELVVHADAPNDLLAVDNLVGLDHVLDFVDRVFELEPAQHRRFLLSRRVAEIEPDQEPVELCFGQGEGPLMVHGVLGRDDEERRRQIERRAVDRDLALAHCFQQRGLGARRGPIDLIRHDDLSEDRAGPELELGRLLVENRTTGDVGREQVRCALHPLERRPNTAGQGSGEHGLGHARHILEQDVPLGKKGCQHQHDLLALANNHSFDIGADSLAGCVDVRHELIPVIDRVPHPAGQQPIRRSGAHSTNVRASCRALHQVAADRFHVRFVRDTRTAA